MARNDVIQHAMLIVSGQEAFHVLARSALPRGSYVTADSVKSAAAARRCILERYYDIIVIDTPLKDEPGMSLARFAAEQTHASIVMTVPADIYGESLSQMTDAGIMVLAKPFPKAILGHAIRYLAAGQKRLRYLEKQMLSLQERMDELRLVSKAKVLLVEKKHMTEDEAHHFIGKEAMDHGISRKRAAEEIIDGLL